MSATTTLNRFPSLCCACGARVPASAGHLSRAGRRWLVTCAECASAARPPMYTTALDTRDPPARSIGR